MSFSQLESERPKRVEFPDVALPKDIVDHWQHTLCFQINNIVCKALSGSLEACSIRLLPYGESPETARPTLIVGCKSTAKVKQALKRFKYDSRMYDVRVKKEGDIRRCRGSRRNRALEVGRRSMAPIRDAEMVKAANPEYQERPLCGASIGAYRYEEHLPPASFGGIVIVDGQPYGMSVHHMLELEDDDGVDEDQAEARADDNDSDTSSLGGSDSDPEDDDDRSTVRPPSAHPSDDGPTAMNDTVGDCPGIVPGDMEEITITQPALDDAIDLDLHAEEDDDDDDADSGIDEDHLLSYRLGQVHVSSGLKRTAPSHEAGFKSISQSLPQEIDWALFELLPPRIHHFNVIKGGSRYCPTDRPSSVRSSGDIACAKVHCLGRTSGLKTGVVSSTMELVKISGRSTFSASWTIAGDFGTGGDSGAWVISNDDGGVCGHVLASRKGRTYICPMDLLLHDIKQTLGATEVCLPVDASMKTSLANGKAEGLSEAINRMYLSDRENGGVPLPGRSERTSAAAARTVVDPVG